MNNNMILNWTELNKKVLNILRVTCGCKKVRKLFLEIWQWNESSQNQNLEFNKSTIIPMCAKWVGMVVPFFN